MATHLFRARMPIARMVSVNSEISLDASCTVVVCSCDRYADLHSPFITLFRKYWPDCPFEAVLVTETKVGAQGFDKTLFTGFGKPWCQMLAEALEQLKSPYVLLLMDDYLLKAPVDTAKFLKRLDEAKCFDAASLRLNPNPPGRIRRSNSDLLEMPKNVAYCITCQAGIWNREFLLGLASRNKSAWEFERHGSFMLDDEKRPLLVAPMQEFPFIDAVHKGYWEKAGLELCETNGIGIDRTKRDLPPYSVRIKEWIKAAIFAIFPWSLIVRIQNALGVGAKEKRK